MQDGYFDIKKWIKKYFGLSPTDTTFERTNNSLEFVWVWSIFEHRYLKDSRINKSYADQLFDIAAKFPANKIDIDSLYGFLYSRYYRKGKTTKFFGNLNLESKWRNVAKEVLKKNTPTAEEKMKLILLVLYQFRCNLFHGRKDPLLWKNFDKVFFHLNKFLADLLDIKWTSNR